MEIPRITKEQLDNWFSYHSPSENQQSDYLLIRATAKDFAEQIVAICPPCADTTAAIRKLRECVMTANSAIACGGK